MANPEVYAWIAPIGLVLGCIGGVLLIIYGFLKDAVGAQNAYCLALPGFLYVLYYGMKGHKIK